MALNVFTFEQNFGEFLNYNIARSINHFESQGFQKKDLRIVLPKMIKENLHRFFDTTNAIFHGNNNAPYIFRGVEIVDGYEDKLIIYWVDWYYLPEIKPQVFDFTGIRKEVIKT